MIQINPLKSYIDGGVRAALTTPPSASLVFDLPGKAIWVKGVKLKGIDHTYTFNHDNYITLTNTPDKNNPESEDIKIGVNITTLKNVIDTTYSGGTLALLQEGLNTEERTWQAKILHNYINDILPVTKNLKINGTNYAIYTTENSLPQFFAPISLGTAGQILACTSSGLSWINQIQNTDYRVSQSSATSNSDYRIILKQGANNNPETDFVRFSEYLTFNPYTKTLKINNIKVVTATDIYTGSIAGLVPAATSAQQNYYLRGDGAWVNIATEMAAANTWRPIKVGNTDALGSGTNTGTLSFIAGTGIALSWDATNKRIIITNSSPDQNHNTDETVRQVPKTDNVNRPLMMINGGTSAGEQINTSMFSTGIYANASTKMITANGFIKAGSSDNYVLLGGGNHKALSDFSMVHSHPYLYWGGNTTDTATMGWGTLTAANGYTILSHASSSDGGDMGFVNKNGQIFMQLDGYYYQREGIYRVLDTSDFTSFSNIGNQTTRITIGEVTKDLKIDADTVDNHHAGYQNNNVALLCPWPDYSTMRNTEFLTNEYGTSGYGYPDNIYLQAICKWAIATYPNQGYITLIGVINPNNTGTCILHLYSSSGKDASTLLPRYCSGTYTTLGGNIVHFGTVNYSWFYKLEALISDIPTVTNYYWANVKVSATSNNNTNPTFGNFYGKLTARDNTAANALLHSGAGRPNSTTGDTWIFADDLDLGNWGIKHDQPGNNIDFYGQGKIKFHIPLYNDNAYSINNFEAPRFYATTTSDVGILMGKYNNTWYGIIRNHTNGNVTFNACGGDAYIGWKNTNAVNFLNSSGLWNSTGLGIGTTSPSTKLHVYGGIMKITNNGNYVDIGAQNSDWIHFYASQQYYFWNSANNTEFDTHVRPYTSGSKDLGSSSLEWGTGYIRQIYARYIDNSANYTGDYNLYIGYHTTYDTYVYTVNPSRQLVATFNSAGIILGNENKQILRVGKSVMWIDGRDSAIVRQTSPNGYSAIISSKTASGSWEIGNYTSAGEDLYFTYITDSNYSNRNNSVTGQVYFNSGGSIYATHFYENSDIRYKKILRNLLIDSNIIANLPLFDFEWIENNAIGTGTSAQAVQQILPNLVSGTDKLTLDYGVLGTIAGITACKELVTQKSEIEQLKEKVKQLEDKLRKYENTL